MFRRRYEAGDQVLPTPQPSQPISGQGSFPAYVQRGDWQNVGSDIKTGIVNFGNSLLSALSNPAVLGASAGVASNLIPSTATYDPPPQLEEDVSKINEQLANRRSIQRAQQEEDPTGEKDYIGQNPLAAEMPHEYREKIREGGRVGYATGGIASRLVRKLLKKHKKDPEVQSSIHQVKKEIDDIDDAIGSMGDEGKYAGTEFEGSFTKSEIQELENDRAYLVEALKEIDEKGIPLDFDETGFPSIDPFVSYTEMQRWEKLGKIPGPGDDDPITILPRQRIKKQEGGPIDEQMAAIMEEEEAMPAETMPQEEQMGELMGETMLPDEEMEDNFVDYVVESSLSPEDTNYLEEALAADDRLSMIFDQVVETASEFSGSGTVEGPGSEVSDSIPARLSDGEFVMTAKATDQIGSDNLQGMMDQAEIVADETVRREVAIGGAIVNEEEEEYKGEGVPFRGQLNPVERELRTNMLLADPRRQKGVIYG